MLSLFVNILTIESLEIYIEIYNSKKLQEII